MKTAKAEVKAASMSAAVAELLGQVLDLSEEQRLELASELIASVRGHRHEDWRSQWLEELDRRFVLSYEDPKRGDDWPWVRERILGRLDRR